MTSANHHVLNKWKSTMHRLFRMKYGKKYNEAFVDSKLNKIIDTNLKNPRVSVFNNYTNTVVRTTVLELTDTIEDHNLIITGGGCLFLPHEKKTNLMIDFIKEIMSKRDAAKKERAKYPKGSNDYVAWDIAQLLNKLVINSLYGCLGYPGFLLYNVFIAEAITTQGKMIVTSAINMIEAFVGKAFFFMDENELFHYIHTIEAEYERYGSLDVSSFGIDDYLLLAYDKLIQDSKFNMSDSLKSMVYDMIKNKSQGELALLYYKNNLIEFSKLNIIASKYKYIIENNGPLTFCDMKRLANDKMRQIVDEIWNLYEVFVLYNYPINDRIRKAMYLPKTRALYSDTDSVFISLYELVCYIRDYVMQGQNPFDAAETLSFTSVNLSLIYINRAIDASLKTLCATTNIPPEWAKLLIMKNEVYFKRIMFGMKKKRYIALSILEEGIPIPEDKQAKIAGFDMIKSGTKPFLQEYYQRLSEEEILRAEEININQIFKRVYELKKEIEVGILNGDSKFYKQSKVKTVENYKNPFSTQGVIAVMLWNTLCPESQIELPADINIVPIKSLQMPKPSKDKSTQIVEDNPFKNKHVAEFADKYPDAYQRLYTQIYTNSNQLIRYMNLASIAIPKNIDILPDYIKDIIDYNDIVDKSIQLYLPVMEALGIRNIKKTASTNHMTNIIQL